MKLQRQIETEINNSFSVIKLVLENESHMHSGNNPESHFKMILVTDDFIGLNKVKRHQLVYKVLQAIMPKFHALALHLFSVEQWNDFEGSTTSPPCKGVSE
jgi:BolA protein